MNYRILHNPRCSKSRETLQLLRQAGIEPDIVEYLKTPITVEELDEICRKLQQNPQNLVRFKEPLARELGLTTQDARSRAEWLRYLAEHPALLERPIVIHGARAVLGRPPEAVQALL